MTFGGNRYLQTPDDLAMRKKAITLLCGYIETLDAGIIACEGRGAYQAKVYRGQCKARLADLIDCYGDNGFFVLCDFGANGIGPSITYAAQSCHRHAEYERERNVAVLECVV